MACLTDLFQPNFLLFLGIFVLIISALIIYFETKTREQNHKLTSMFSLISALADEINTVKLSLTQNIMGGSLHNTFLNNKHLDESIINDSDNFKNILINVSDDEEDDSDDEDSDDEDSDDEDIDEEDSDDEDSVSIVDLSDDESIKNLEINSSDLKVFKFEEKKIEETNSINFVNLERNLLDILENSQHLENHIDTVIEDETNFSSSIHIKETENSINDNYSSEFKTIHINLEEQNETLDFKKLPVNKLRDIVTEKLLTNDASKLKKGELLKLLGCE